MILYVPVWAYINKTVGGVGNNPGYGTITRGDSLHVVPTVLWTDSLWEMVYLMIETTTAVIPVADSALKYTHDGIKDYHMDWGTGTHQVSTDDITEGSSNLFDQDLPDSSDWSTAYSWGDHSGQNYLDEDNLGTWKVFYSDDGTADWVELALGADGTYLRSNGASAAPTFDTPPGGDPGSAIHDSVYANTPGYATNSEIGDTITANWAVFIAGDGDASEADVHDSLATHYIQRFVWPVNAIEGNIAGGLEMLYPVAVDNFDWTIRYTATSDNSTDTALIFSFRMPMGCDGDGLDTIAFNARTTGLAVEDASIEVMVYKRTADGGAAIAIDSLDAFNTAGAWEHKIITGFSTNASPGDWIRIEMIVNCDATDDTVFHDLTYGWYTGI